MKIYRFLLWILTPIFFVIVLWRFWKKKEHPVRFVEKFGLFSQKTKQPIVWIHAVSVGEIIVGMNIARIIHHEISKCNVLLTSTTVSSADVFYKYADLSFMEHAFLPLDHPFFMDRFFSYFQPKIGILIETSFWPVMLSGAYIRNIPLCLLDGKMSQKSFCIWKCIGYVLPLMNNLSLIFALNYINQKRFLKLCSRPVYVSGYMKIISSSLPLTHYFTSLKERLTGKLVWIAASIHVGEEGIVFSIFTDLKKKISNLVTILAPRYTEEISDIIAPFSEENVVLYKDWRQSNGVADVIVVDSMGILGDFFRVSDVVLVCGSLVPGIGGHNVLEPLKCGSATVNGVFSSESQSLCDDLVACGALYQVSNDHLALCIYKLLIDVDLRLQQICAYRQFEQTYQVLAQDALKHLVSFVEKKII